MATHESNLIQSIEDIPVPDNNRRATDVLCTVVALLLVISLLAYCCVIANRENIYRTNFPSDGDGRICGTDLPGYKYLYFTDVHNLSKRVCVSECPTFSSKQLKCIPTYSSGCKLDHSPHTVTVFDTKLAEDVGPYCLPNNDQLRKELLQGSRLDSVAAFADNYTTFWTCTIAALILGMLYFMMVACCPQFMNQLSIMLGALASVGLAIGLWKMPVSFFFDHPYLKIGLVALAALTAAILVLSLIRYRNFMRVSGIFLDHASRFILGRLSVAMLIPMTLLLAGGLIALTIFQLLAVWSQHKPLFNEDMVFYQSVKTNQTYVLSGLVILQFYLGLHFLRQLFNFCVAANAITWYFHKLPDHCQPVRRLLRFHLGSVLAAAFMTAVFWLPDLLFDIFRPRREEGLYGRCFGCLCGWLSSLFQLVRSDALAYVNLASLPYCNSSRFCDLLCRNSSMFHSSYSVSRVYFILTQFYRLGAHMWLGALLVALGWYYRGNAYTLLTAGLIFSVGLFLLTYFVSLHADAAEALSITFLTEQYLNTNNFFDVKKAPGLLVPDLMAAQRRS